MKTNELLLDHRRFEATVSGVRDAYAGGRTLVFCHDVNQALVLTAVLRSNGARVDLVLGDDDPFDRDRTLRDFAKGKIDALVNVRVLATGYDLPTINGIVLTAPVESAILFEQMVGRVARGPLTGGAEIGEVWELDDHRAMHGLPQSYYRFDDSGWEWVTSGNG